MTSNSVGLVAKNPIFIRDLNIHVGGRYGSVTISKEDFESSTMLRDLIQKGKVRATWGGAPIRRSTPVKADTFDFQEMERCVQRAVANAIQQVMPQILHAIANSTHKTLDVPKILDTSKTVGLDAPTYIPKGIVQESTATVAVQTNTQSATDVADAASALKGLRKKRKEI